MSHYQIAVAIGSLRRNSYNPQLANAMKRLAPEDLSFYDLRIDDLPLYNQDADANQAELVQRLKREVAAADGLIFVTPEYNRSVAGVLKNASDNASRPYGQSAWKGKPAGIIGASIGAPGTSMAQQHLRNILAYLDVPTLGQSEAFIHVKDGFFDAAGEIANADTKRFLQGWMDAYAAWIKLFVTR
jgi:chromate reductase, NAD(P)H dehydrogenase (quinone)